MTLFSSFNTCSGKTFDLIIWWHSSAFYITGASHHSSSSEIPNHLSPGIISFVYKSQIYKLHSTSRADWSQPLGLSFNPEQIWLLAAFGRSIQKHSDSGTGSANANLLTSRDRTLSSNDPTDVNMKTIHNFESSLNFECCTYDTVKCQAGLLAARIFR